MLSRCFISASELRSESSCVHGPHGPLQAPEEITARSKSEPDHGETTSEQTPSPPPRPLPKTVTRLWSPPKARMLSEIHLSAMIMS